MILSRNTRNNVKQLTEKRTYTQEISTALGTILSFNTESPLKPFVFYEHDIETIDFSDPYAVKALNKSLLTSYYNIKNWDIPEFYLCYHTWPSRLHPLCC
jgi:hypothetical protein